MNVLWYLLPVWCALPLGSQQVNPSPLPNTSKNFFRLGDQLLTVEKGGRGGPGTYVLVSLHGHDEGALQAMHHWAGTHGSNWLQLVHADSKNVEAQLLGREISFDPNSIFTASGRRENLKRNHCYSRLVAEQIESFAYFMMGEIPVAQMLVTLHSGDSSTIYNYKDGEEKRVAKDVYLAAAEEKHNFLVTNSQATFNKLKDAALNVVLLYPKRLKDDGSLNFYCVREDRDFVEVHFSRERSEHRAFLSAVAVALEP